MNVHKNARLTPRGRERIVRQVESGQTPDVPTTAEAGMPTLSAENWYAMMVPANLPPPIMGKLRSAAQAAVADAEFRAALAKQGAGTGDATPERLAQWVATEAAKWGPIARAAGIKLD